MSHFIAANLWTIPSNMATLWEVHKSQNCVAWKIIEVKHDSIFYFGH